MTRMCRNEGSLRFVPADKRPSVAVIQKAVRGNFEKEKTARRGALNLDGMTSIDKDVLEILNSNPNCLPCKFHHSGAKLG